MGQHDPRIDAYYGRLASVRDLPTRKQLLADIRRAMKLNEDGMKTPAVRKAATPRPAPEAPADLAAALAANPRAKKTYDSFPPSGKRDYIEWLTEAKRDETRARRLAQAIEWMAQRKPRNWKYMR